MSAEVSGFYDGPPKPAGPSPWCDKIVLMLAMTCFFAMIPLMGAFTFLLPDILFQRALESQPADPASDADIAAGVAQVLGYLMFPDGVCNMITTMFFFMPLKKRFGEVWCISVAGVINAVVISLFGFVQSVWGLAGLMCIKGCCGAFMLPVAAPLAARYSAARYPDSAGQVQSIPALGISLGATLGQSVVILFKQWVGVQWAWVVCACCILIFVFLTTTAIGLIDASIDKLSPDSREAQEAFAAKKAATNVSLATGVPRGLTFADSIALADEREALLDPTNSFVQTQFGRPKSMHSMRKGRSRASTAFSRFSKFTNSHGADVFQGKPMELS